MNLRAFHAVLILLSAALAVMVGLWCLSNYRQADERAFLAGAVASFGVSLGLGVYDSWFLRKTRALR